MAKKIICPSCGAKIDGMAPKCPYCENMNLPGAEAEYMKKLEDVREDLKDLEMVPEQETRKIFRKRIRGFVILIIVIALFAGGIAALVSQSIRADEKKSREQMIWAQTQLNQWDDWYDAQEWEALLEAYTQAQNDGKPVWLWKHYDTVQFIWMDREMLGYLYQREKENGALEENLLADLLYYEMRIYYATLEESGLEKHDREILAEQCQDALEDFHSRWGIDKEYVVKLAKENYGYIKADSCKEYVKEHPQKKQ